MKSWKFNHGAVTKEAATLETHLCHDREHYYQVQYFSPTTYPQEVSSRLASCRQVHSLCIGRCGGKRWEKKATSTSCPLRNFLSGDILGLANSTVFQLL